MDTTMLGALSPAEVKAQMERILADALFTKSQRLGSFLRFAVQETLAGRDGGLKEYSIATQVLDRGTDFNPQEDPIVRIMAGRLRAKLAEYYVGAGAADSVIIELPRGGYAARFLRRALDFATSTREVYQRQSVGRLAELARLERALDTLPRGGRVVVISGDAGMGKTTFVEDFLAGLIGRSVLTARGRSSERLAESGAYAPLLDALDNVRSADERAARLLESVAPAWYQQVTGAGESKPPSQERLRRELASFVEQVARLQPVVLFLDDLHWADASTCDLLVYLSERIRTVPLLVIGTYRPGAVLTPGHPFLAAKLRMERSGRGEEIPLSYLSENDVWEYLDMRFPGQAFGREFCSVVWARTEGHPLFLTDLVRYLVDQRMLVEREGLWTLVRDLGEIRRLIPAGTHAMIGTKLAALSEEDRGILLCGAVQGMQFDSFVVAQALHLDPAWVEERLREFDQVHRLVDIIGEQDRPGVPLSVRYQFKHVFYQNSLYALLTPSRRATESLAVAAVLAGLSDAASRTRPDELAVLYESGRDYAMAAKYFLHAARKAARVFAYPEASLLCERGMRALVTSPESSHRDEQELLFQLTLGMALMSTRGYAAPEVEQTYRRARDLCLKLNEIRRRIPVLWAIHTCLNNAGRLIEALEIAEEMREAAESLGHKEAIVESLHAHGTTMGFMGRLAEARQLLERIVEIAPVSQHEFRGSLYVLDPLVTSLSMLARVLVLMGEVEPGKQRARESLELARRLAHPHSVAYGTFWIGWVLQTAWEHAESLPYLESAMEMGRTYDLPLIVEWARVVRGSALSHSGRRDEGIAEMRKSIERQDVLGAKLGRPYCLTLLAEALLTNGDAEEALTVCERALDLALETGGLDYQAETHRLCAEALRATGGEPRIAEAKAQLEYGLARARESGSLLLERRLKCAMAALEGLGDRGSRKLHQR